MAEATKPSLPLHPLIVSLTQAGQQSLEKPIRFAGYVGPSSQKGTVRIYSTLNDLSRYVEFDETAVVQTAEAPETLLPDNALCVWIKASTPVRWIQEFRTASDLEAAILSNLGQFSVSGNSGQTLVQ